MSYQVIARKWRPQTFAEVTGQETITRTLRNAIEHERLHHAYLFSGARGVGKTTTARLLAKALNCHRASGPTPVPCRTTDEDACASCREIADGRSIDVLEIDAASNTGVDNVRDAIIGSVAVHPARDRYKVFIIDEVHMLSGAAFNALLKTLEEPPPRVVFIMATTEQHKVPDTILSRCQQFEFRTIATPKIAERLALIAAAENVRIKDDALREIARAGEGSMRDAQSAFDQVISFSEGEITVADVETALGIASAESRARVMRAVSEQRPAEALAVVDDLVMRGHDLRNFCRDLLAHLRDLLVVKVAGAETEAADATAAERRELQRLGAEFSESDLVRFFHSLTETEKALRESAHPRYQLEIGLVKLIEMRRLAPLGQVLERLAALEEALRTGRAPADAPASGSAPPATRGSAPRGASGSATRTAAPPVASHARASTLNDTHAEAPPAAPEAPVMKTASLPESSSSSTMQSAGAENFREAAQSADAAALPPFSMEADADGFTLAPPALKLVPSPAAQENGETDRRSSFMSQRGAEDYAGPGVPVSAQDPTVERIKDALDERRKPFLVIALEGARRVRVDENELYVEYAPESKHLRDTLAKPENVRVLREVCQEVLGRETGVRITIKNPGEADDDSGPPPQERATQEKDQLREMAENHPLVQQVLKTFRGEIIDVRRSEEP